VFQTKDYKTKDSPPLGIGAACSRQKTIKLRFSSPRDRGCVFQTKEYKTEHTAPIPKGGESLVL
jgi:hypothetical protein